MNGIKPGHGINGFQVTLLPCLQLRQKLVGHGIDGSIGELHALQLGDMRADVLVAVAEGKQGKDLSLQLIR